MALLEHISHSSMSTWLQCPARWAKRYIEYLPERRSLSLVAGSVFHRALALLGMRQAHPDEVLALVPSLVEEQFAAGEVDGTPEEATEVASDYLRIYLPLFLSLELKLEAVEEKFYLDIPGTRPRFLGYIDLVARDKDGQVAVLDFKTADRRWSVEKAARSTQHIPYVLHTARSRGVRRDSVVFEYHVVTRNDVQVLRLPPLADSKVRWWEEQVRMVVRGIEAGVFPANPDGWWCSPKYCAYYAQCPAVA